MEARAHHLPLDSSPEGLSKFGSLALAEYRRELRSGRVPGAGGCAVNFWHPGAHRDAAS